MSISNITVDGYSVRLTRRQYPGTTYTWVEVYMCDEWHSCGDPWPSAVVPKSDIIAAIAYLRDLLGPHTGSQNLSCFV
jgi:hypothetical protein